MDRIFLNEMEFYGYHGALPEENRLGQRFRVTVVAEADLRKAGASDRLEDTINYAEIYQVCKEITEGPPCRLLEAVAERIAQAILERFSPVREVAVKVIKPDPPIPGHYQSVAVEIRRGRSRHE